MLRLRKGSPLQSSCWRACSYPLEGVAGCSEQATITRALIERKRLACCAFRARFKDSSYMLGSWLSLNRRLLLHSLPVVLAVVLPFRAAGPQGKNKRTAARSAGPP